MDAMLKQSNVFRDNQVGCCAVFDGYLHLLAAREQTLEHSCVLRQATEDRMMDSNNLERVCGTNA